jgi:hypothetical protein
MDVKLLIGKLSIIQPGIAMKWRREEHSDPKHEKV